MLELVILAMSAAPCGLPVADDARPNIVLIMADDLGYECVGADGGESYRTPNLDELAKGGMRFTECHSQPLCTPSRVQIMTGRYNSRNYVRFGHLDPEERTFANMLRDAGYATCIVGKWQLGGDFEAPAGFGFDEYCLWQLTLAGNKNESRYASPTIEQDGTIHRLREGAYGPDVVSDYACSFIERHQDEPFLLYYPMILPHWPFEPTSHGEDWDPESPGLKGRGQKQYFGEMVAHTDRIVGKLVAKLDELGLRERTLVLFTGDNGTAVEITSRLAGTDYPGGKGLLIQSSTHVPLIVNWPGQVGAGEVNADLIDFTDFLPTLADAAKIEPPTDGDLDGQSFMPQLRGGPGTPRQWVYCWFYRNGKTSHEGGGEFAHTHRYKYDLKTGFYDLENDPGEAHPIDEAELTDEQREVRDALRAVVERFQRPVEATSTDE